MDQPTVIPRAPTDITAAGTEITVEREASFEVSRPITKNIAEDPIFADDVFSSLAGEDISLKEGGVKASDATSPTKVTDFVDDRFSTPPSTDIKRVNSESFDPWADISESDRSETQPQRSDFKPDDFDKDGPSKVLFPAENEPNDGGIARADILDENGFPVTSFTPDLASSIKERYEEQKGPQTDPKTTEDDPKPSEEAEQLNWKTASGQNVQNVLSGNCCGANSTDIPPQDIGGTNEGANTSSNEEPSQWERFVANLPRGQRVKANILQVRQRILACQEPSSAVVFDDDNIDTSIIDTEITEPTKNADDVNVEGAVEGTVAGTSDGTADVSTESVFASILSTSQDMLSIPSDAPTPVRSQTKGKATGEIDAYSLPHTIDENCSDTTLKLYVDLYEQAAFRTLMANLEGNLQVEEIHVFRSWDGKAEKTRTKEDMELLFKMVRSLSNLKMLHLANFLVEEIHFVSLSQWQNEHLTTIRIHLCKGALSARLLDILSTMPALEDLTLEMNQSFPLHILLGSQTLESLTIVANGYDIDNLHAIEMVHEIAKNEALKKLDIQPALGLRTFKLLVSALSKNVSIEHLQFSILPGNVMDTNRAMTELAHMLMSNESLKTIRNINYEEIEVKDRTADGIMKALSDNYIIEDFLVFDEEPWFYERKTRILKENMMEEESLFPQMPQVFSCGNQHDDNASSASGKDAPSLSDNVASLGDNAFAQAHRLASGAMDFVGRAAGLQK